MMNRYFSAYRRVTTDLPPDEVFAAFESALRSTVGGMVKRNANMLHVENGTQGVSFGFVANVNATLTFTQAKDGSIEANCQIVLSPNTFFWIMGILGFFCLWFLWVFNLFFFLIDPTVPYQTALDRAMLAGANGSAPPVRPFQ